MLTPLQYNQLCDDIAVLYAGLENSIIEDMTRRIVRMGYVSDSSTWQANMLMEAGMLYEDILAEIALETGQTDRQVRELFRSAGIQSVRNDNFYYRQAGLAVPRNMSSSALQILNAGYQKCAGNLKNLTLTTANTSQQAFIQACNLAYMQTSSGTMDYNTAVRKAIQSAAGNGAQILYPSGHSDKLDVAVRRAVLTGVGQTVRQISFQNAKDTECDLMEITAHAGARPSHAEWQGQIVSLSGRKGYLSTSDIGYGTADGFGGVNCRHDWFPFFEGVSVRAYSDERLKELAEHKTTIDGVDYSDYELSQKQRYLERQIREKKRQVIAAKASADNAPNDSTKAAALADFQKKSVQLKTAEQKLNNFLSKTGFLKDSSRTWVNGFGRSISQKVVWANRKAQQGKNPPPASPASPSVPKSPKPKNPSGSAANSLTSSKRSGIISARDTDNLYKLVTQKSLDNIPHLQIFDNPETNVRHYEASKNLLEEVMKHNNLEPGTEFSIRYEANMFPVVGENYRQGTKGRVGVADLGRPFHAFHNHASDETFSYADLRGFLICDNMISFTAQGNQGSKYVIFQTKQSQADAYWEFLWNKGEEVFFIYNGISYTLNFITFPEYQEEAKQAVSKLSEEQKEQLKGEISAKINECLKEAEQYGYKYIYQKTKLVDR